MAYLLDSSVLIDAKNRHYGFEFCPAFWEWLVIENRAGRLFSIEKVGDEIAEKQDELSEWASKRGERFFLKPDTEHRSALQRVSEWVSASDYRPAAKSDFFDGADYYLVAYALAYNHTVVTQEITKGQKKFIKIPDACVGLDVKCVSPFHMLRKERPRFVLER